MKMVQHGTAELFLFVSAVPTKTTINICIFVVVVQLVQQIFKKNSSLFFYIMLYH
jgi:hypothetical protein